MNGTQAQPTEHEINMVYALIARHNLSVRKAARYFVTGTTANCQFNKETTRKIAALVKTIEAKRPQ